MLFRLLLLFFCCFWEYAKSEISSSSDLNCDFSTSCRWINSTEGNGQFVFSTLVEADAQTRITPRTENDPTPFAYTSGLMGRTLGLLVSEVISCQLGGANIKYWYYKSGQESSLEVCIRQPPGNRDINSMRCYDGVSATFARQWIFRAVELPPIAQPFEIVFKTFFNPPHSIIAIDDINFAATLCGGERDRRRKREIRRIGIQDWQSYKKSNLYAGELMLIVAQDIADGIGSSTTTTTTTTTTSTTSTTTEVPTTTLEVLTTTEVTTTVPTTTTEKSNVTNEQHFANFVNFLKQAAPVIPLIPSIVKSFSSLDPGPSLAAIPGIEPDVRRAPPVTSSHYYHTNDETLVDLAKKFGIVDQQYTTIPPPTLSPTFAPSPSPSVPDRNSFGLARLDSVYPQNLIKSRISPLKRIEEEHRKLFTSTSTLPPTTQLIVFKNPTVEEDEVATKLADIAKLLPQGAVQDLTSLRNIPDLEGLTKGMDLGDIKRPGGFSRLKKEFMERLMRRTLGLPIENPNVRVMPSPIVPMKVTRRMMMEKMRRTKKLV